MTKEERQLAQRLNGYEIVHLERYKSVNGKEYYKTKTTDGKPLNLITKTLFNKLSLRNGVIVEGVEKTWKYTLNVIALRAMLLDWQTRKDLRALKPKRLSIKPRQPF